MGHNAAGRHRAPPVRGAGSLHRVRSRRERTGWPRRSFWRMNPRNGSRRNQIAWSRLCARQWGKYPAPGLWPLGTRPADSEHWFSRLLENAEYAQCHAARPDDPPFQRRTWAKANPSLKYLPNLEKRIRKEAAEARRDPSKLAEFQALRLNMGTPDTLQATLFDAGTWRAHRNPGKRTARAVGLGP